MHYRGPVILLVIAIACAAGLYVLPKSVVDDGDEALATPTTAPDNAPASAANSHAVDISPQDSLRIRELRAQLDGDNPEKFITFADSLAELFAELSFSDSAAYYAGQIADRTGDLDRQEQAGAYYFDAFSFAMDPARSAYLASQAQKYWKPVVEARPQDLDLKARYALTFVPSNAPMQGIFLLREIIEEEPSHELARYQLALLSLRSGQTDKAIEHLTLLTEAHPDNLEGWYLLGETYFEQKDFQKARPAFEKILEYTDDPRIVNRVESFLQQIN